MYSILKKLFIILQCSADFTCLYNKEVLFLLVAVFTFVSSSICHPDRF